MRVTTLGSKKQNRLRTRLSERQIKHILTSYVKRGESINEIARGMKIYPQMIHNCLKRNDIVINSKRRDIPKGEKNSHWKGGRRLQKGYVQVQAVGHPNARPSDGYIYEHRLVMSEKLGRPLKDKEIVHHVNGDTLDNRIENLELVESNGKHISEHIPEWKRNSFGRFSEKEDIPTRCIILKWKGEKHHVAEWARRIGVSKNCMYWRLDHGKIGKELFAPSSRKES